MKIHGPYILAISIFLTGCSELGETAASQTNPQLSSEDNTPASNNLKYRQEVESTSIMDSASEEVKSKDKDYSELSHTELDAEYVRISNIQSLLEVDMDAFPDDDPRWDILDGLAKKKYKIANEKSFRSCKRLRRLRALIEEEGTILNCEDRLKN